MWRRQQPHNTAATLVYSERFIYRPLILGVWALSHSEMRVGHCLNLILINSLINMVYNYLSKKFSSDHSSGSPKFCLKKSNFFRSFLTLLILTPNVLIGSNSRIWFQIQHALYTKLFDENGVNNKVSFLLEREKMEYKAIGTLVFRTLYVLRAMW